MNINIQTKSGIPIYSQIEQQIRGMIVDGTLRPGEALPSIRSLAADCKISVITTKRAYGELEEEGMIYSVQGKGFFVDNPDVSYLEEKKARQMEERLDEVLGAYRREGYTLEEMLELVRVLYEE